MPAPPPANIGEQLHELIVNERYVEAGARLVELSAPESWREPDALLAASATLFHLGAPARSERLDLRAFRIAPGHPRAVRRAATYCLEKRGPVMAYEWLRSHRADPALGDDEMRAEVAALRGRLLAILGDERRCDAAFQEARRLAPDSDWVEQSWIGVLERRDDVPGALSHAQHLWKARQRVFYARMAADLLVASDRDDDAEALLVEATKRVDSGWLWMELGSLLAERQRFTDAEPALLRAVELFSQLEAQPSAYLAMRLSDCRYHQGDIDGATRYARWVSGGFATELVARLTSSSPTAKRVLLQLPFVRQHQMTCAPATLATISRFWKRPAEHLQIAEEICFDGTTAQAERRWAERHGWVVQEFRITWDATRALIDRGVPFTATTMEATSAHLQAVVGYDERRGSIVFRDPDRPWLMESIAQPFFDTYEAHGPRGMVLVPDDRAELLDDLELPEAQAYDAFYQLQIALDEHRRADAEVHVEQLRALCDGQRLWHQGQLAIAAYDRNREQQFSLYEQRHPRDQAALMHAIGLLPGLATHRQRLAFTEIAAALPGAHPAFRGALADELLLDAGRADEAARHARAALRRVLEPSLVRTLACAWRALGKPKRALRYHRLAATIGVLKESFAMEYFRAAHSMARGDAALELLRDRHERFGAKDSGPTITYCVALCAMARVTDALAVVRERVAGWAADERKPDASLLLYGAELAARCGERELCDTWFEQARDLAKPADAHLVAATVAELRGDHDAGLEAVGECLRAEPDNVSAVAIRARITAVRSGRSVALDGLSEAVARFPNNPELLELQAGWLIEEEPSQLQECLRRILAIAPANADVSYKLVLSLLGQGDLEGARLEVTRALRVLATGNPVRSDLQAAIAREEGDSDAETTHLLQSLKDYVDDGMVLGRYVQLAESESGRAERLKAVWKLAVERSTSGEAFAAWYDAARAESSPAKLLKRLDRIAERRPELRGVRETRITAALDAGRVTDAVRHAEAATQRFGLDSRMWLLLAQARELHGDGAGQLEALERATTVDPTDASAALALADFHVREGNPEAADKALHEGLKVRSGSAPLHLRAALAARAAGDDERAAYHVRAALSVNPTDRGAWRELARHDAEVARKELDDARKRRPWSVQLCLVSAYMWWSDGDIDRALADVQAALELDSACLEALDVCATLLAEHRRYDDALALCRAHERYPELEVRAGWVTAVSGNVGGGATMIASGLARDPANPWGWRQHVRCQLDLGESARALTSAKRLVQVSPRDAESYVALAQAAVDGGDWAQAAEAYRRACALAPTDVDTAARAVDVLFVVDDVEGVRRVLEPLGENALLIDRIALACATGQRDEAMKLFRRACREEAVPHYLMRRHLSFSGLADEVFDVLEAAVDEPTTAAWVGSVWVQIKMGRGEWGSLPLAEVMTGGSSPARQRAVEAWFATAGNQSSWQLWSNVVRNWKASRHEGRGAVGAALLDRGSDVLGAIWLYGYPARDSATPAVLYRLANAQRNLGFFRAANAVNQRAVELPRSDGSVPYHHTWLAFEAARQGRIADAHYHGRRGPAEEHAEGTELLTGLSYHLLTIQQAPDDATRREAAQEARGYAMLLMPLGLVDFGFRSRLRSQALDAIARHGRMPLLHFAAHPFLVSVALIGIGLIVFSMFWMNV